MKLPISKKTSIALIVAIVIVAIIGVSILASVWILFTQKPIDISPQGTTTSTLLAEVKACPSSCDDGNPCTRDYCSFATNYGCRHDPITPCCGNGICESGENCETCSQDCGECKLGKETITYSDIDNQIAVSDFKYTSSFPDAPAICIVEYKDILDVSKEYFSKEYSFKIRYTPISNRDIYFQAYTTSILNSIVTSNPLKLTPGENKIHMISSTSNLNDDLDLKLCFSYEDFFIDNDDGKARFYKGGDTGLLDSSEYVCITKVFEKPNIDVTVTPSTNQFYITTEKNMMKLQLLSLIQVMYRYVSIFGHPILTMGQVEPQKNLPVVGMSTILYLNQMRIKR